MVNANDDTTIKIADFGFAKKAPKPFCLRTLCGTAQYVAPEVLDLQSGGYDCRADMWSVGVVVYILLGGYAPFEGPVKELARAICKADYAFHDKYWSDISEEAKGMISSLLEPDIERRLSAEASLQCPWMMLEEEELIGADLSGAQAAMKKKQQTEAASATKVAGAVKAQGVNKYDSLDVDFTAGMGTAEEVLARKSKRTANQMNTIADDEEYIEDSSSGKPFETLYKMGKMIDEGDFAPTYEARHRQSKEVFAVKTIERVFLHPTDAVALQDEIATLRLVVDCPQIIKLFDVFEEPDNTYMVMERLPGGPLIERITDAKPCFSEPEARKVALQLLKGLEFCHNRRIAIRSVKMEAVICVSTKNDTDVRLSDFSLSKKVLFPNALQTACGTEGYVAPEILEHRPAYDVQCDMWSMGVTLYMLLGGYRPFRGEGEKVMKLIRYGEFKFHKKFWSGVSEEAKVLISRMLTVNPITRITATAALQSDWIKMATDNRFAA